MRKLLFDLRATQEFEGLFNFHGGAEYGLAVLSYLSEKSKEANTEIYGVAFNGLSLDGRIKEYIDEEQIGYVDRWEEVPEYAKKLGVDCFYSVLPYEYDLCNFDGIDVVFTIHGLRQLEMPCDVHEWRYATSLKEMCKALGRFVLRGLFVRKKYGEMKRLLSIPARSLSISVPTQHTKYSLISHYPKLLEGEIFVCPSPLRKCDPLQDKDASQYLAKLGLKNKGYILLVSSNRWLKNSYRGICALDELYEDGLLEHEVVLAGMDSSHQFLKSVKNPDRFHAVGYVEPELLETLYKFAFLLLYPTLNEGFGYPPVEAMKYGTPVIASAVSAVSEVCAEAALYMNPYSVSEIKNRILQLSNEREIWLSFSKKGRDRYAALYDYEKQMVSTFCDRLLTDRDV